MGDWREDVPRGPKPKDWVVGVDWENAMMEDGGPKAAGWGSQEAGAGPPEVAMVNGVTRWPLKSCEESL